MTNKEIIVGQGHGGKKPLTDKRILPITVLDVNKDNINEPLPHKRLWTNDDRYQRLYWEVRNHINGKRSIRVEYNLIKEKKSELNRAQRDWVINYIENGK